MKFSNARLLNFENDIKTDWVSNGYLKRQAKSVKRKALQIVRDAGDKDVSIYEGNKYIFSSPAHQTTQPYAFRFTP